MEKDRGRDKIARAADEIRHRERWHRLAKPHAKVGLTPCLRLDHGTVEPRRCSTVVVDLDQYIYMPPLPLKRAAYRCVIPLDPR